MSGTIKVLTEVLSLVNPSRLQPGFPVTALCSAHHRQARPAGAWQFEAAAMMSQLGCVTLEPEMLEAIYAGQKLPAPDQARFDAHPAVARPLIEHSAFGTGSSDDRAPKRRALRRQP